MLQCNSLGEVLVNKDYSILVVDDSVSIRLGIVDILRAEGFDVEDAENGVKAIEKCSSKTFDLFIIDVVMPEIDGLELLTRLNVFENTYEAIMITGSENLGSVKQSMELGAYGYIGKSAGKDELIALVKKTLKMVDVKKQRLERIKLLEKKAAFRSAELESMVRLLEYQGRQLDAVINSMDEGIVAIDNQKSIVLMNRQAEIITGSRFADCAGLQVSKAFPRQAFADQLSLVLEKGSTSGKDNPIIALPQKGGGEKYFYVNTRDILDEKGVRTGSVVIFSDQTDAIAAQRMRDSFLSIAAHELRTPINISMNYLSLLEHQWKKDETRTEAIRGMQTANHRLMYLVNRIVSLANLSNHTYSICRTATDISRLIELKIRKIQPEADDKNVKIIVDDRLSDPVLSIDPYLLRIVLNNVLSNAVKFNRIGGTVRVTLEQNPGGQKRDLIMTVSDEGGGISERARKNLFESFMQGEDPLTRTQCGTGTGLFLVKKALEVLNGSIDVISEEGKGTILIITVPIV